jgi:tRNA A-37 threonylcarbamoyl transferase component Bud32
MTTRAPSIPAHPPSAATTTTARPSTNGHPHPLLTPLINDVLEPDREYHHYAHTPLASDPTALQDFVLAADGDDVDPGHVFDRLRWGGQFVFASRSARRAADLARQFQGNGFILERRPVFLRKPWPLIPFLARRIHYFVARKVHLIRPGEFTERFTYHVELVHHHGPDHDGDHVVLKRVPTFESVVARLRHKFPDTPVEALEKRARKFTDKIFPTFLTREAAILMILQEHLPRRYASRVPRVIDMEKDIRGFVTSFKMNWLRNGGRPLSQIEFAMQAADLLQAVHDSAGIIHLDLRLDNMVITEHGVGFVDFGSAVRVNENLASNPMLGTLFEELMKTSHIQRMLYTMTKSGEVTASHFVNKVGKVDKGVDVFYLALQFTTPHANPDLANLIHFEPNSEMARRIAALSKTVLRPGDPNDSSHQSAKDILRSLELIDRDLMPHRR